MESPRRQAMKKALMKKLVAVVVARGEVRVDQVVKSVIANEVNRLLSLPRLTERDLESVERHVLDFCRIHKASFLSANLDDILSPRVPPPPRQVAVPKKKKAARLPQNERGEVPGASGKPRLTDQEMRAIPSKGIIQLIQLLADDSFLRKHGLAGDVNELCARVHKETVIALYNLLFDTASFRSVKRPREASKRVAGGGERILRDVRHSMHADDRVGGGLHGGVLAAQDLRERQTQRSKNAERAGGGPDPPWTRVDSKPIRTVRGSAVRSSAPELSLHAHAPMRQLEHAQQQHGMGGVAGGRYQPSRSAQGVHLQYLPHPPSQSYQPTPHAHISFPPHAHVSGYKSAQRLQYSNPVQQQQQQQHQQNQQWLNQAPAYAHQHPHPHAPPSGSQYQHQYGNAYSSGGEQNQLLIETPLSQNDTERVLHILREEGEAQRERHRDRKEWIRARDAEDRRLRNIGVVRPPWEVDTLPEWSMGRKQPVSEEERVRTLVLLKAKEKDLITRLGAVSFSKLTDAAVRPSVKERQRDLEMQLREVESAIQHYSRTVVYMS